MDIPYTVYTRPAHHLRPVNSLPIWRPTETTPKNFGLLIVIGLQQRRLPRLMKPMQECAGIITPLSLAIMLTLQARFPPVLSPATAIIFGFSFVEVAFLITH